MKFRSIYTLITFLLFLPTIIFSQQLNYVQGEVLVKLKNENNVRQLLRDFQQFNGKTINMKLQEKVSDPMNIYTYSFDWQQVNENELLEKVRRHPMVEIAQFNHFINLRNTPDDPQFIDQWQYINTGQSGGTAGADIDADLAWDIATGGLTPQGDTIVVCIIDDGCQTSHPDLEGNIWYNYAEIPDNGIDDDNNGFVDDFRGWNTGSNNDNVTQGGGHGTPVTGIIGARGNNGVGVAGVNWNVKLMSVVGGTGEESEVLTAYSYPLVARKTYNETNGQQGAFVVSTNASWGVNFGQPADAPLWCAFYDTLGVYGILSAGATINGDYNVDEIGDLPTACPSDYFIAVTNMNDNDQKVQGAGYGVETIDLGAFGADTWTLTSGSGYGGFGGTSGATPHVTGTVALLYSVPCSDFINLAKADPGAAVLKAKEYILEGGDDNASLEGITVTGKRLNMHGSMKMLMENCGPCPDPGALVTQNVTDTLAELIWVSSGNATSDTLRWRALGAMDWTIVADAISPLAITGLMACSEYEFQVKSQCDTLSSEYANIFIFKTDGCCENPTDFSVVNISDSTVTATWESVLAAQSYNIQIRPVDSIDWITDNTTNTSFEFTGLAECQNYEIQIQTVCDSQIVDYTPSILFATSGCGPCIDASYCAAPGLNAGEEWLDIFTLNTIENTSGNNDGYGNFTGMMVTELATYGSYDMSISPGYTSYNYNENVKIWIDYNADGDFEDLGEEVFEAFGISETTNGTIVIPSGATLGLTRLRVMMSYDDIVDACSDPFYSAYGEIEDYCVYIVEGELQCNVPTGLDTTLVSPSATVCSWDAVNFVSNYVLRYKQATATDWTEVAATANAITLDTLAYCKDYEAQVKSVCGEVESDFSESFYFKTYCNTSVKTLSENFSSLSLSPNPFGEEINVQFTFPVVKEKVTVELLNKLGQIIASENLTKVALGSILFDGSQLSAGLYFVRLKMEGGVSYTEKIVKY